MNIALINPPQLRFEEYCSIPLGLLSISSYILKQHKIKADIIDMYPSETLMSMTESSDDYIFNKYLNNKYDICGISTNEINIKHALRIATIIKESNPSCIIVLGGPEATLNYKTLLQDNKEIDCIVLGEGEQTFNDIITNDGCLNNINGIAYRSTKGFIVGNARNDLLDLTDLPLPDYKLLDYKLYQNLIKENTMGLVESGRGCAGTCTYCYTGKYWRGKVRYREPILVYQDCINQIELLGVSEIFFTHDNIIQSHEFVDKFTNYCIKNNASLKWQCYCRIDMIDSSILDKFKAAGCTSLFCGIESGDRQRQKRIKKDINLKNVLPNLIMMKKKGIKPVCSFIINFPFERRNELNRTLSMAIKAKTKTNASIAISSLKPIPDTKIYNECQRAAALPGDLYFYGIDLILNMLFKYFFHTIRYLFVNNKKKFYLLLSMLGNKIDRALLSEANFIPLVRDIYLYTNELIPTFGDHKLKEIAQFELALIKMNQYLFKKPRKEYTLHNNYDIIDFISGCSKGINTTPNVIRLNKINDDEITVIKIEKRRVNEDNPRWKNEANRIYWKENSKKKKQTKTTKSLSNHEN